MAFFKKAATKADYVNDGAAGTAGDVRAVMEKYDRESFTREFAGVPRTVVRRLFAAFSLYVVYMNMAANWGERERRASFVGLLLLMAFTLYPVTRSRKFKRANYIPWYDCLLGLAGAFCYFWFVLNLTRIVDAARPSALTTMDLICAIAGVLILLEATRRVTGAPIVVVAACFLAYAFISGVSLRKVVFQIFYTLEGVLGTPIGVCSTFIMLFILFGALLEMTGVADFFIRMANALVGWASGGPAKVAVIASALEGMVSGSSVANTVGSGSVTIPMMIKTGYRPEFAGAVEAAASTGGQIMPPIMGAAAFLMAQFVGIPYTRVAVKAVLPAALYFTGVFLMVHLEAKKTGLTGIPRSELPRAGRLFLREGYLIIPVFFLVVLLGIGWKSTAASAMYAAAAALVIGALRRMLPRPSPGKAGARGAERVGRIRRGAAEMGEDFVSALENAARNTIGVGLACAAAGIVAGVVTMTGVGQILITGIVGLAGNHEIVALVLTMVACIVLGMGVPTTANYVVMATTCAPILIKMGIPDIAAHMFVFYFGIVADITPPVALAAYAGSAIAGSNPMKTALTATKLAVAAFIVPYVFALSPAMLFVDTGVPEVVLIVVTAVIGMLGVSVALEGYAFGPVPVGLRLAAAAGGLLLIVPGVVTDLAGLACVGGVLLCQSARQKKPPDVSAGRAPGAREYGPIERHHDDLTI